MSVYKYIYIYIHIYIYICISIYIYIYMRCAHGRCASTSISLQLTRTTHLWHPEHSALPTARISSSHVNHYFILFLSILLFWQLSLNCRFASLLAATPPAEPRKGTRTASGENAYVPDHSEDRACSPIWVLDEVSSAKQVETVTGFTNAIGWFGWPM